MLLWRDNEDLGVNNWEIWYKSTEFQTKFWVSSIDASKWAMENLRATRERAETSSNNQRKGSSIGYDDGVDSSAQQGKDLDQ